MAKRKEFKAPEGMTLEDIEAKIAEGLAQLKRGHEARLEGAVIAGGALRAAKLVVPHGEFIAWVKEKFGVKKSWANTLMGCHEAAEELRQKSGWPDICAKYKSIEALAAALKPAVPKTKAPKADKPKAEPPKAEPPVEETAPNPVPDNVIKMPPRTRTNPMPYGTIVPMLREGKEAHETLYTQLDNQMPGVTDPTYTRSAQALAAEIIYRCVAPADRSAVIQHIILMAGDLGIRQPQTLKFGR